MGTNTMTVNNGPVSVHEIDYKGTSYTIHKQNHICKITHTNEPTIEVTHRMKNTVKNYFIKQYRKWLEEDIAKID